MTKKLKIQLSGVLMCVVMLVTSISVFAKTRTDLVPLDATGNGMAKLYIADNGYTAQAWSSGSSVYSDFIYTYVFGGGPEPYDETGDTTAYVQCGSKVFTYAQSKHVWTGRSYPMELYL